MVTAILVIAAWFVVALLDATYHWRRDLKKPEKPASEQSVSSPHNTDRAVAELSPSMRQSLEKEYQELCSNMRHYGNARLTRLTILGVVSGGLLAVLFRSEKPLSGAYAQPLKALGLLLALVHWSIDWDTVLNYRTFRDRARDVEQRLGLNQYSNRHQVKQKEFFRAFVSETTQTQTFYMLLVTLWLLLFFLSGNY